MTGARAAVAAATPNRFLASLPALALLALLLYLVAVPLGPAAGGQLQAHRAAV